MTTTVLLPGISVPAHVAFAALLPLVRGGLAKELEVYRDERPPVDYGLGVEVDGLARFVDAHELERVVLYGHSLGGTIALAFLARHPDRVAGIALNEPATDFSAADRALIDAEGLADVPEEERVAQFVRQFVRPGVELPPQPPGPPGPEMAKRPAGIAAAIAAVDAARVELPVWEGPAYFGYGTLSNARWEAMAARIPAVLPHAEVVRYEGRHHLDAPHTREPERVATALQSLLS